MPRVPFCDIELVRVIRGIESQLRPQSGCSYEIAYKYAVPEMSFYPYVAREGEREQAVDSCDFSGRREAASRPLPACASFQVLRCRPCLDSLDTHTLSSPHRAAVQINTFISPWLANSANPYPSMVGRFNTFVPSKTLGSNASRMQLFPILWTSPASPP